MTRRFENCQDAVGNAIDKADAIDSSDFFNQMFTAQFGIWMSFTGIKYRIRLLFAKNCTIKYIFVYIKLNDV